MACLGTINLYRFWGQELNILVSLCPSIEWRIKTLNHKFDIKVLESGDWLPFRGDAVSGAHRLMRMGTGIGFVKSALIGTRLNHSRWFSARQFSPRKVPLKPQLGNISNSNFFVKRCRLTGFYDTIFASYLHNLHFSPCVHGGGRWILAVTDIETKIGTEVCRLSMLSRKPS